MVKARRKPIHRHGYRNALCPKYRECLDLAVRKSWEFWDCAECEYKGETDPEFDIEVTMSQNVAYYDLPMEFSVKM